MENHVICFVASQYFNADTEHSRTPHRYFCLNHFIKAAQLQWRVAKYNCKVVKIADRVQRVVKSLPQYRFRSNFSCLVVTEMYCDDNYAASLNKSSIINNHRRFASDRCIKYETPCFTPCKLLSPRQIKFNEQYRLVSIRRKFRSSVKNSLFLNLKKQRNFHATPAIYA